MKAHTVEFKNQIIELGRELRGIITYGNVTLEEEIYSITPHYEADILKSVMKQLDIELSQDIPLNTVINCRIGIKVNDNYEMLNYGNYVVYSSEKQEDKGTYKIICYDKMLYSMKQNEDLGISYPITIKNYLIAVADKIGLTVANSTFYNQDMQIPSELYVGLDYTYRDILDEIAEATGSIICLNENDEIIVKYPTQTNDTIDENFLKDVNVNFKEKYGVINSVVLSRSGESDNVYLRDEESVALNGLTEVKIVDNQIMNFNNRSDYLQGLLNALDGLYYYINDFNSTGILYYEVGDLYNIQVGEMTYQCLMLNDEINVTTGIEEIIHTDMPEKSETDYTKADKTDRRINQTYLIVDKQNQKIEGVISNVTEQNTKISQLTQTVDELSSQISDISDITTYGESDRANVELQEVNESEPIMVKVHPTSINISYLYPRENLYPSDVQYLPDRIIRFTRTYIEDGETKTQNIDYTLPDDLLRYSDTVYDEFYLDYESRTCQVTKRCAYNADGTVRALGTEVVTNYEYPTITLGEGDYAVTLPGYDYGYIYVRLMAKNIYTTQFYTKVETNSIIDQKADQITLGVNQTLSNYSTTNQMNSAINLKADSITSTVSATYETKSNAQNNYSQLTQTANSIQSQVTNNTNDISTINQTIDEVNIEVGKKYNTSDFTNAKITATINDGTSAVKISANKIALTAGNVIDIISGSTINLTSKNIAITSTNFSVDKNGNLTCSNANITGKVTATSGKIAGYTINGSMLVGNNVGISGRSGEGYAFWAGSSTPGSAPFRVNHSGTLYASNATISGTVNATNGTFENCTITNSCTVPAGTINGVLSAGNIPNINANKIETGSLSGTTLSGGTLSGTTINGATINGGQINASAVNSVTTSGDIIAVNNESGHYEIGNYTGENYFLIVQQEGQYWRRLTFKGGILVNVESEW